MLYDCKVYQVIQKTKVPKFTCKLCSAKQSIRKVFLRVYNCTTVRLGARQAASRQQGGGSHAHVVPAGAGQRSPVGTPQV
eukprot:COSAG01_NODE_3242_length_6367_cov_4.192725_6_plen_80_part_00